MKQTTFASLADAGMKKRTRRERFLGEMEAVVPWARLVALIEPHCPNAGPNACPNAGPNAWPNAGPKAGPKAGRAPAAGGHAPGLLPAAMVCAQ